MGNQIIYNIKNVTKKFPGVIALNDVSFDIIKGEIHAIVGENGAGKSTLMNILSGAYPQTSGNIQFKEKTVHFNSTREAQHMGIAMIHQELSLSPTLSIAENIYQGRLPKGKIGLISTKKLIEDSKRLMKLVGLEAISPLTLVKSINASQQQQVEIAKALSLDAEILILDEPTSALTPNEAGMLLEIMKSLRDQGITMIYISHKLDEVMEISDRITVLRDGCYIETLKTKETNINQMISLMVGREYTGAYIREHYITNYDNRKTLLEVEGLNVGESVKNVSFRLYEGEVLGITGLVGAGRSEVLQAIFGADKKDSGIIKMNEQVVEINHCQDAIKYGIGLVPEGRKTQGLFLKFNVQDNINILNLKNLRSSYGLIKGKREKELATEYVKKLNVKTPTIEQKIINLSGGNQQKAIIARWLINKPKILFLDEPTQGIDIGAKEEIYDIIDSLSKEGVSVIIVSSEMQEMLGLCDRIIAMYEGEIMGEILHKDVKEEVLMTYMSGQVVG